MNDFVGACDMVISPFCHPLCVYQLVSFGKEELSIINGIDYASFPEGRIDPCFRFWFSEERAGVRIARLASEGD